MKTFTKIPSIIFCDPCFYAIFQKFRLLDCVILLDAAVLRMTLKGLGIIPVIILMVGDVPTEREWLTE